MGNALHVALHYPDQFTSFIELNKQAKRATPEMLMLHITFNEAIPETEWVGLNFQQITMSRQREFKIVNSNNLVVGLNILCNKFYEINGKICLDWLNMDKNAFKIAGKGSFLTFASLILVLTTIICDELT